VLLRHWTRFDSERVTHTLNKNIRTHKSVFAGGLDFISVMNNGEKAFVFDFTAFCGLFGCVDYGLC
jgi:hypothetical protein